MPAVAISEGGDLETKAYILPKSLLKDLPQVCELKLQAAKVRLFRQIDPLILDELILEL